MRVSTLCLGGMAFGHDADEKTSCKMMDFFMEAGGNFIDTSNNYSGSEEIIGSWLKKKANRRQVILSSKVRFPTGERGQNDVGLSRRHIIDALDDSLRRLQTDYLDVYQAHCWDFVTPIEETMRAFNDVVTQGKVRYIGASNFGGWHLMKALSASDINGWCRFVNLQSQYSLITRTPEWEILPACRAEGITVTAWSPLAAGWLTGKYARDTIPPADSRMGHVIKSRDEWDSFQKADSNIAIIPHPHKMEAEKESKRIVKVQENERRWRIIDAVRDVAKKRDRSCAQVSLAWILTQPGVLGPVLGARTLEQLQDNLGSVGWKLSAEETGWLNEVSDPGSPYPLDFFQEYGIPWR